VGWLGSSLVPPKGKPEPNYKTKGTSRGRFATPSQVKSSKLKKFVMDGIIVGNGKTGVGIRELEIGDWRNCKHDMS